MKLLRAAVTILTFTILLLRPPTNQAQVAQSALAGTVTDPQGNRVPGASIRATNTSTGFQRGTQTTSQGDYALSNLPVGLYIVSFTKSGFAGYNADRVQAVVGHTRTLNARLSLAGSSVQQTSVTEPLVQLDKNDATVGAPVEQEQIHELPLNGRNWASLTALVPGAIDNGPSDQRSVRFAGHGLDDNNLTLDGVDATAIYNQEQRQYVRLAIPLGAISQFQVQSQNFQADMEGGTAGGQVAVASSAGTNNFHGDAFEFFRNDALDSRSPFDGPSPNPFLLNQFGGDTGGPIVKDHTFFYANYEGIRQRLGQTQIGLVPSPSFVAQAEGGSPALTPLLSAYPAGTSPRSANVWNYTAEPNQTDNENSGMIRFDEQFSDRTTGFVRFNTDYAENVFPVGPLNATTDQTTIFRNGIVELNHVISPSLVNEAKFGINQEQYRSANISASPYTLSISGFSSLNGSQSSDYEGKTFSLLDDTTWMKGRHQLKFGFEVRWVQLNQGNSQSGTLTYNSIQQFSLDQLNSATYIDELPLKRQRKTQYWGYIQDTYKATQNLTLNLGIRYNYFNVFHEVNNRAIPFDFASCGPGGYCPPGSTFSFPRSNDFDPRIGVAWSRGNTVFRGGGGIYHTDGQEDDQNLPISNDYQRYSLTGNSLPGLSYPILPFLEQTAGVVSPRLLDRNRKDAYVTAWTASLQQSLPGSIVGTVSYLGNKGTDLLTTTYVNLLDPATGLRPYPAFGAVAWRGNDSNSTFHAFQLNARRAFQNGFSLAANYMWSHSINDGSIGGGESDTVQDPLCRACDKASSDNDVRSVFNTSVVYQLPFGAGRPFLTRPGAMRELLGGWELNGIATARTGLPVNVVIDRLNSSVPYGYSVAGSERPNYITGASLVPAGGQTPDNWINPAAFAAPLAGTFGNLGRNALRGPVLWQVDLALARNIPFTERLRMQLRAEVFNAFNRAQYGNPNADLSTSGNFGVITTPVNAGATGSGTPRQIQLAARITF